MMKYGNVIDIHSVIKRRRYKRIKKRSLLCCYVCILITFIIFLSYTYMLHVDDEQISAFILPKY